MRVFVCDYIRTPIGRYGGGLSTIRTDDLAAMPLRHLAEKHSAIVSKIDEVFMGCANQAGEDNRNVARMATLLAGLPETVPAITLNRLCASGMDAVIAAYRAIFCEEIDIALSGGVESMSRAPFVMPKATTPFSRNNEVHDTTIGWRFVNKKIAEQYGIESMPETGENVAEDFDVSRDDQDRFALASQTNAATAQESGRLAQEIMNVRVPQHRGAPLQLSHDEYLRATTYEKLASLPTPFREDGSVTAGNASGVNDGAAALLIASEKAVETYGLIPLAEITGSASAGVEPRVMGIGPVPAILKLCKRLGASPEGFEVFELNEAFASQAIACCRELGLDPFSEHINPNGGAIALGHPLGMTGARIVGTTCLELNIRKAQSGLVSMCVGVGQGVALSLALPA